MVVKFIGKEHIKGVSKKTGRDFDFINCYFTEQLQADDFNSEKSGLKPDSISVSPKIINFSDIQLNKEYDISFNRNGFVDGFTLKK